MIIIIETGAVPTVVSIPASQRRPAVAAKIELRPVPSPASADGEPQQPPTFEEVEVAPAQPEETIEAFHARMIAAHVPSGARHFVTDATSLPAGAPELWAVDFDAKTITINDAATLDAAKADAHAAIDTFARQMRKQFAETDDPVRLAAWAVKADIARRVAADTASPADVQILADECTLRNRGETPGTLAARILYWAQADGLAAAMADGMQKAAHEAVDACQSVAAIEQTLAAMKTQAGQMVAQVMATRTGPDGNV
jgi:hypothetical protein